MDKVYNVHVLSGYCAQKPNCIPQCQEQTCAYLCRHMLKCTCLDYAQGYLCKHAHKVHTIYSILKYIPLLYVDQRSVNCTTDNMDCVPSHHPLDMGQVDTTLEASVEKDFCTWPVKKTSSGNVK